MQLICNDRKQPSGCLEIGVWRGRNGRIKSRHEETLGSAAEARYLTVLMVSWVYTNVTSSPIVQFKYAQFMVYQLYLNMAVSKNKNPKPTGCLELKPSLPSHQP